MNSNPPNSRPLHSSLHDTKFLQAALCQWQNCKSEEQSRRRHHFHFHFRPSESGTTCPLHNSTNKSGLGRTVHKISQLRVQHATSCQCGRTLRKNLSNNFSRKTNETCLFNRNICSCEICSKQPAWPKNCHLDCAQTFPHLRCMWRICLRTGGSSECCFGIGLVHENENVHGMIGQANWWHTRGFRNQATRKSQFCEELPVFFPPWLLSSPQKPLVLEVFCWAVSRHVGKTGCLFLSRWPRRCQRAGPVQARALQRVAGRRLGSGGGPEARPGVSSEEIMPFHI